jgi:hypothetical protein
MVRLSKESAEKYYKKLLGLHCAECLTPAQKVSVFQMDLEHYILKEITGKHEYFDQLDWLKKNQTRVDRYKNKTGFIPPAYISDIENLKKWRNRGVHENDMPEKKYESHFHTMAQTIKTFSGLQWPTEIDNILKNRPNVNANSQRTEDLRSDSSDKNVDMKIPFVLIGDEKDIKNNITKFKYILENERGSEIINRFSSFTYWYYFSGSNIFVPNKFLAYRNCANSPYEKGCKMNGSAARNKLSKYFNIILDENRINNLLSKFNQFSKELNQNVNVNITFLEPTKEYHDFFNK